MTRLPSNWYKRNTGDLSKKGVAGIMRNGIILTDRRSMS